MTLREAILNKDLEVVKDLLVKDPNSIEDRTGGVWLPFLAASLGDLGIVRYIVEYSRASFNETDELNRNVLHYGVESGNISVVRYLVERVGMSPVSGDINLVTPYQIAYKNKNSEILSFFEEVCGAPYEQMYHNPIRTGMHPDPSIICVGDDFYMVNSSFIFFPCIPISHSKDLIHWKVIGHAITNPEWAYLDELEGGRGYWAPDISYYEGKYYITATYRLNDTGTVYRKQMVVSSDKPEGPYCEPVFLDEDGIDPSIFTDDDGRRYMLLNRGARLFEISKDGKKQLSEAILLYYGHQKRAPEGSHLLKKDGWYYLFQAEGGTGLGHRISVARSKELFGVYTPCPYNPIMRQQDEKGAIQRCGHGKPVKTPNGEWYMVYLCGRQLEGEYSLLGRETALDPITWTADGWPIVNNLEGPSVLQKLPNLTPYIPEPESDDFENGILSSLWVSPRVPEENAYTFGNGYLKIKGSKKDLDTTESRNILLRRQQDFHFTFEVTVGDVNLNIGQDYGLTCYYDENTYLKFGLFETKEGLFLQVVEHIDEETKISLSTKVTNGEYRLRIVTEGLKRSFYYQSLVEKEEANWCSLGLLDRVYYLCDEGINRGKRFTGAMVGMYAHAGGNSSLTGEFKNIVYQGMDR